MLRHGVVGMGLLVVAAVAASLLFAIPASAGTVTTQCGKIGSAYGSNASSCVVVFQGPIAVGDAARVADVIRLSPSVVEMAEFDSPGGDPFEALKITAVLNESFVAFSTGSCGADAACLGTARCSSACALIFLTSNTRYGTEVFLHRPAFPPEMFRSLSGPAAEAAYNVAVDRLNAELRKWRLSDAQIQMIMGIPSDEIKKVAPGSRAESPWLEEWLASKCGPDRLTGRPSVAAILCRGDAVMVEQQRVQRKGRNAQAQ